MKRDAWIAAAVGVAVLVVFQVLFAGFFPAENGKLGYWGSPVVRSRGGKVASAEPSAARSLIEKEAPPKGVILIVADTLRRDHFQPYGYERENAPRLTALAADGIRFADNISQGAWTKVAVTSMLTSLYPSTHGVSEMHHRVSASVTTLAETTISTGDLINLRVGDIITTDQDIHAPLTVEVAGLPKFKASPGAWKGHIAIEVIERKIYNGHDFLENLALAFAFPGRIEP